ncbi:MAG: hypothetical protein ACI87J_002112 [Colwellia sp.]|jgi:hypothetical protein
MKYITATLNNRLNKAKSMMAGLALVFMISCSNNTNTQPNWIITPKQDTIAFIYAIGQGDNLESANASALRNITTKLGVTISSKYKQRTIISDSNYSQYIVDDINLKVQNTSITSYQQLKNLKINGIVYSLIKVDKTVLTKEYNKSLSKLSAVAVSHLNKYNEHSGLVWWLNANQITNSKDSRNVQRIYSVLRLIDPFYELDQESSPWTALNELIEKESNQLCISITSKGGLAKPFVEILKSHVLSQQIKVTPECEEQIHVTVTTSNRLYYGMFVSREQLNLTQGNGLNKTIMLTSQSATSYANATQSNLYQLIEKLHDKYLWETLGFITLSNQ